ncbi:MAG: hypothetical protein LBL26_02055 [Peptococcaceae bacterium]|jgi:hypothetical protein|nr:hypothetical protein [Peptococcaceae bacterium]
MKGIPRVLRNKAGQSFPLTAAVTLSLLIVFSGISEYLRLIIIAQGVRDALQDAVTAAVTENYDDVYHGVREGYSGGYQPMAGDFEESLDYGDIYRQLDRVLGLSNSGGYHAKPESGGGHQFRIWGLSVSIRNAAFAADDSAENRFEADASVALEVPLSFGGGTLPPMRTTVRVTAGYTPKF